MSEICDLCFNLLGSGRSLDAMELFSKLMSRSRCFRLQEAEENFIPNGLFPVVWEQAKQKPGKPGKPLEAKKQYE